MSNKILRISQTILEIIIQCIVFLSLAIGLYLGPLHKSDDTVSFCFLILVPVLVTYILRRTLKNYTLFIIGNAVFVVFAIMLSTTDLEAVMYAICAIAVVARSIHLKQMLVGKMDMSNMPALDYSVMEENKDEQQLTVRASEKLEPYYAVVMVVMYIVGDYNKSSLCMTIQMVLFIAFVILQVIYNQVRELNEVFVRNSGKSEFPARQIIRINVIMIGIIILLMIIAMSIFYQGEYGGVLGLLGSGLMFIIKPIIAAILKLWGSGKPSEPPSETEAPTKDPEFDFGDPEIPPDNSAIQALFVAFSVVLVVAVAAGVIYLLYKYSVKFKQAKEQGMDTVEFIKSNRSLQREEKKKKRAQEKKESSINIKYRKLYKKNVLLSNRYKAPNPGLTPKDITSGILTKEEERARRITESYEKARYSRETVTKEELEYLKKE